MASSLVRRGGGAVPGVPTCDTIPGRNPSLVLLELVGNSCPTFGLRLLSFVKRPTPGSVLLMARRPTRWEEDDDRPRRRRGEDEDDPRPRRRQEDDDDEDRQRSRWRDEDFDSDERPNRGRGEQEEFPRRRRPRRKSSEPNIGKILAIACGGFIALMMIVAIVYLATRTISPSGRGDISFEKYTAIGPTDTIEGLRQKFGRPKSYDRADWGTTVLGDVQEGRVGGKTSVLLDYNHFAREVTAWYGWHKGEERVYLAEGTDSNGRRGLVIKIYLNPKVVQDAFLKPDAPKTKVPWFRLDQIGVGGHVQFGGG